MTKEYVEQMILVVNAMNGKQEKWGCLSVDNVLFTVGNFKRIDILPNVVKRLLRDEIIHLPEAHTKKSESFYKLTTRE